jgi:hypothetical protein
MSQIDALEYVRTVAAPEAIAGGMQQLPRRIC